MQQKKSIATVMLFCAVDGGADVAWDATSRIVALRASLNPSLDLGCWVRVADTGMPPSPHQRMTAAGPPPADLVVVIRSPAGDEQDALSAVAQQVAEELGTAINRRTSSVFSGQEIAITPGSGPALLVFGIRRRSDHTQAQFMHHWYDKHLTVSEGVSGVRYRQCHVDESVTRALALKLGFSDLIWDGVTLSYFDDIGAAVTLMSSDMVLEALADEELFIEHSASSYDYYVVR